MRPCAAIPYPSQKDESFYTVAWMRGKHGQPLLAASGSSGVIRIIDCWRETVVHSFIGHGGAVNEVRVHPSHPALLLSAGKDESLRLWNADTGVCVAIVGGSDGHRNEVLSAVQYRVWYGAQPVH
ncbi:unnamed protein product [Closterium sp. Yama58-4]|nr:unnamed protein product [Closterium sp. Yama58-4]